MGKDTSSLIVSVVSQIPNIARLLVSLFFIWLTLGWKVRKAKRALEKELLRQGMSKQDAKRISGRYAALKDQAMYAAKRSLRLS